VLFPPHKFAYGRVGGGGDKKLKTIK